MVKLGGGGVGLAIVIPSKIPNMNHKKELLWSLWVVSSRKPEHGFRGLGVWGLEWWVLGLAFRIRMISART